MSKNTFTSNIPTITPVETLPKQFVLDRTDMSTSFSDSEYQACLAAITAGQVIAVNWIQGGTTRQLQLVTKSNTGVLKFAYVRGNVVETWTVAASSPHIITDEQYTIDTPVTYVNESYASPDAHIDYDGTLMALTCEFDTDAVEFVGLVHVRFNKPNTNFTVAQYVNGNSNGIISTASMVSGATHFTMPVVIEQGKLKVRISFDSSGAPSNVKFDLIGLNH